ncbi:unnamed protein product [Paramecium sonneborni]|uniref:EGF-like domain-containing protein n=1 Tax=Paramecium sonneborni TaxID=65129 RepID=A0A8S1QEL1_9CILI|nr:unnamed protein product [Paramecium sonneborni]
MTLYYEAFTDPAHSKLILILDWTITNALNTYSDCAGTRILGGFNAFGRLAQARKFLQLPPHYSIYITMEFWKIDSWDGEFLFIYLDGTLSFSSQNGQLGTQYCGQGWADEIQQLTITQPHVFQSVLILITTNLDSWPDDESWGFRDFKLYLDLCPPGCLSCSSNDQYMECLPWILVSSAFLSIQSSSFQHDGWSIINGVQDSTVCSNIPLFGGYNKCAQYSLITKVIELPSHYLLKIRFRVAYIDSWDGEYFYCHMDGNLMLAQSHHHSIGGGISNICGQGWDEYFPNYEVIMYHQKSYLIITFSTSLNENFSNESFGIRDFEIFSYNPQICGNGVIEQTEQCDDGNIYAFDGCFICQYSCVEGCLNCIDGICFECDIGWIFKSDFNTCIAIVNDQKFQIWEECDDYLNFEICKNGKFICPSNCLICEFGICYDCIPGWKLIKQQCQSTCGDNQIQILEECDDNNLIRFDGCNKCQNDCQRECSYCFRGICLDCIYGWHLNNQFICETQCGDSQIALISYEECDYSNSNSNQVDQCIECKLQCCHYCDGCIYGICYNCEYTFTLIDQICTPVCGDGLITIEYEQCDDMNLIPYDGCYECKYQCRQYCKLCIKGICYDHCEYGFYEFDNQCITKCGDGIIAGQEDCDDLNDNQTDGCHNCQFHCPDHCDQCIEGKCKLCEPGYALIEQMNICKSYCGNGMISLDEEECDDENNEDGDGCSRLCKIETDYQCKNFEYSFSQCTYSKQPRFYLQFREERDQNQYVTLLFTQQVKNIEKDSYSKYIQMNLVDVDINIYKLNLIIIQDAYDYVTNVEYVVEIQINATLEYRPILEITLDQQLYNSEDAILVNQYDQIQLRQPKYLDDQKLQAAATLTQANEYIMNSMGGIGILAFFLGNSFIFSSILEVLQQQSYLRFINVIFPFNLFIYFESSNIITIKPILQFFRIDSIQTPIYDSIYIKSYEKLEYYEINADLLTNIQTQVFLLLILFIIYFSCISILHLIDTTKIESLVYLGRFGVKLLFQIKKQCLNYKIEFRKVGLKTFLIANCWDILFTCFLQFKSSQQSTNFRSYICLILAYLILYGCLMILAQFVNKKSFIKECFINYWISKMDLFFSLKKLIFIFILVCFQKNQQIQTILLTFVCQIYLSYVIKFKPFKNQQDFFNHIMMEGSAFIFTFSSAIYWSQTSNLISYDKQVLLGWLHIIMLLFVLFVNLLLQVFELVLQIKFLIQKKLKKQNQENLYNSNPYPLTNLMEFKL